ncbi:hypothetical protein bsdtb5_19810 [Anaeromicropila herbilytica]|uniref:Uncharacterized protein n=1 Tax=Anaeromicropila herbilytica TaxID=2785025 RepID=A0A7R7EKR6_9FIRM|nr:hypothetical protein bsdtb5_19810 [Anaeromicropila herbilytica]
MVYVILKDFVHVSFTVLCKKMVGFQEAYLSCKKTSIIEPSHKNSSIVNVSAGAMHLAPQHLTKSQKLRFFSTFRI